MKINLFIELFEHKGHWVPKFHKTIEVDITPQNISEFINGEICIGELPNCHHVKFTGEDFDLKTMTLRGKAKMLRPACNGYVKDLKEDGWLEVE